MTEPLNLHLKAAATERYRIAMKKGHLVRAEVCEHCGERNANGRALSGHHRDYAKPLDVVWLCAVCHAVEHETDSLRARRAEMERERVEYFARLEQRVA